MYCTLEIHRVALSSTVPGSNQYLEMLRFVEGDINNKYIVGSNNEQQIISSICTATAIICTANNLLFITTAYLLFMSPTPQFHFITLYCAIFSYSLMMPWIGESLK